MAVGLCRMSLIRLYNFTTLWQSPSDKEGYMHVLVCMYLIFLSAFLPESLRYLLPIKTQRKLTPMLDYKELHLGFEIGGGKLTS